MRPAAGLPWNISWNVGIAGASGDGGVPSDPIPDTPRDQGENDRKPTSSAARGLSLIFLSKACSSVSIVEIG